MKYLFILWVLCQIINNPCIAQKHGQERIDSLTIELAGAKKDSNNVKLLIDLCFKYYSINPDEGIKYGKQALDIAEEIKWEKGIANANGKIGINYWAKSDYPDALKFYFIALKINEELGNKSEMAKNQNNIGLVYWNQSDYPKALEYFNKALKMYEVSGDKTGIAGILGNIGLVYDDQSDYVKALDYYFKALKMNEELGDRRSLALNLGNIGTTYSKQNDYPKALEYEFKALKIQEESGNENGIETNFGNIGNVYLKIASDSNKVSLNNFFGGDRIKALKKSEIYLDSAIAIQKEIGALIDLKKSYKDYSEIQASLGNYKGALESFKNYSSKKDSVFNNEKAKSITQMQMKFDQEKTDAIAAIEIKKQRQQKYGFIVGIIIVICFSFFLFRQKKKITKEKKRSDDLLLNILPVEIAEELKETGHSKAKNYDQVTVLFTDFKNFTKISESMSPENLVAEIDRCFSAFDNIIQKCGIEKIKTIGDSYMAVGGLPVANKSHAKDVVNAAIEINKFMEEHKQQRIKEDKEIFEIRIGIHTGSVVAGIVGIKKFAYDIWGDTVNLASRMESSGEEGKINISGSTYELVKNDFNCTYRGKIQAKNKGEMDMYFVG